MTDVNRKTKLKINNIIMLLLIGGTYRVNYKISLFRNTFYFDQLQFRNYKREGGGQNYIFSERSRPIHKLMFQDCG